MRLGKEIRGPYYNTVIPVWDRKIFCKSITGAALAAEPLEDWQCVYYIFIICNLAY